jgi:protein involved in polysaccharide export with SLBB domain
MRNLWWLLLAVRLAGQGDQAGANLPSQPIGATDLLAISVYGAPEMTRTVRVSDEGLIGLPMVRRKIDVRGRMPGQVEALIAEALIEEEILVDPAVAVTIAEYHSRPISVAGAVKVPLTFQAMGKTTLLEALTRAQGLSDEAGPEILLTRAGELVQRIPVKKLIDAADPVWNVTLVGGEEVRVPAAGHVFVAGNVKHPGAFRVDSGGETTVLKAVALAEGLAPFSTKDAYIFRAGQPEILVELSKIMDRKSPDVVLAANDILYVRREFLGEVRCLVFDVAPVNRQQAGKFVGRIWVEDRDAAIVRFNGTYVQPPPPKSARAERYFHFDSWRVNAEGTLWVPAQIYVEEEASMVKGKAQATPHFKAQTRIWDYAAAPSRKVDELTSILIDNESGLTDQNAPKDISPLESQRSWERQAEENLLARLEKGGFLSAPGPVDEVLNTVVNNLIISAKLKVEAHCRVLLTTPFETFAIGRTIVISRGLIDVLPDEASLALALASELAHIALGQRTPTQFAFNNQTMLSDFDVLQRFHFERPPTEMLAASQKTIAIMHDSPYQNTANAGLFLKALSSHEAALPRLLQATLGDQVADPEALARLAEFAVSAPPLEEDKLEQIAALPLGSRVKVNPWLNHLDLVKTRPLALLSPREKMPFEVTPFLLYLTRIEPPTVSK